MRQPTQRSFYQLRTADLNEEGMVSLTAKWAEHKNDFLNARSVNESGSQWINGSTDPREFAGNGA